MLAKNTRPQHIYKVLEGLQGLIYKVSEGLQGLIYKVLTHTFPQIYYTFPQHVENDIINLNTFFNTFLIDF